MSGALLTSSICLIRVSVAFSEMFPTNTVVATLISDADMLFCGYKNWTWLYCKVGSQRLMRTKPSMEPHDNKLFSRYLIKANWGDIFKFNWVTANRVSIPSNELRRQTKLCGPGIQTWWHYNLQLCSLCLQDQPSYTIINLSLLGLQFPIEKCA